MPLFAVEEMLKDAAESTLVGFQMLKPEGADKPLQLPLPTKENTSTTAPLCSRATTEYKWIQKARIVIKKKSVCNNILNQLHVKQGAGKVPSTGL